mmetsp:Transcript_103573/g.163533  ORF Transcript_103573/g.163533 Transcript_103573/m.163533 type:complete len:277 (+) Transcript_103573:403-1233(+)
MKWQPPLPKELLARLGDSVSDPCAFGFSRSCMPSAASLPTASQRRRPCPLAPLVRLPRRVEISLPCHPKEAFAAGPPMQRWAAFSSLSKEEVEARVAEVLALYHHPLYHPPHRWNCSPLWRNNPHKDRSRIYRTCTQALAPLCVFCGIGCKYAGQLSRFPRTSHNCSVSPRSPLSPRLPRGCRSHHRLACLRPRRQLLFLLLLPLLHRQPLLHPQLQLPLPLLHRQPPPPLLPLHRTIVYPRPLGHQVPPRAIKSRRGSPPVHPALSWLYRSLTSW